MDILQFTILGLGATVTALISMYSWNKLRTVSYLISIWFVLAVALGQVPYFQVIGEWQAGDLIGFAIFGTLLSIPLGALLFAWKKNTAFQNFLETIPTWLLVSTQSYRMVGLAFLIFYLQGVLPFEVGFVTGVFDILVALSAVTVAWLVYHKSTKEKPLVLVWCGFGLLDFALAFTIVGLSFFGLIQLVPEPTAMAMPPLTIISIFQVPLAMFIHIYLINRVLHTPRIPLEYVAK